MKTSTLVCAAFMAFGSLFVGSSSALLPPFAYTAAQAFVGKAILFHVSFTFLVLLFWTFLVRFSGPPTPSCQKE